jgi:hypothetical protein
MTATQPVEHVSFNSPDEVREGENWRMELVNLAGGCWPPLTVTTTAPFMVTT